MSRCVRAALGVALILAAFGVAPAGAAEFTDSAGRIVVLPDRINRVMAAGPTAEVLIYVLAPDKLAGWTRTRPGMAAAHRRAVVGQLTGATPTATAATVSRLHPDLIIDSGKVTPQRAAFADEISQATGVPFIVIDNSFDRTPSVLRIVGRLLGVADRGDDLAISAEHAINTMRGRLLIQPPTERPRVYYARGRNGLETVRPNSSPGATIEAAGAINVTRALEEGDENTVTLAQIREWNPDYIIVEDRGFYQSIQRDPAWRSLAAVRNKKVFLQPPDPFGWIDDPPGVNRLVGLYWLTELFYPGSSLLDVRTEVADVYDKFYHIKLSDAQIEAIAKTAGIPPSDTPHLAALPALGLPTPVPVPGGANEPGRRGLLANPPVTTTPSYMMPK